jgi:hypothetical protein
MQLIRSLSRYRAGNNRGRIVMERVEGGNGRIQLREHTLLRLVELFVAMTATEAMVIRE